MIADRDARENGLKQHGTALGEAVSLNGVDLSAVRRAHFRELTMARQAAERRSARPNFEKHLDAAERLAAAHLRSEELRVELARIDSTHWLWLHDQGTDLPERLNVRGKGLVGSTEASPQY